MSDEWQDPVEAKKVEYRHMVFDSLLEKAWYLTLEKLGAKVWDHPAALDLQDGRTYEPDFLVGDVLCEVKGPHDERIDKPYRAYELYQLPVLILRPGQFSGEWDEERPGAVWEACDGRSWGLVTIPDGEAYFKLEDELTEDEKVYVHFSADRVQLDMNVNGLEMRHHSDEE